MSKVTGGINRIFYGAPGCGKSFHIKKLLENANIPNNRIIRVTFHPEYSNCDFIGQIIPTVENDIVKYTFNPGPFLISLKKAYDTDEMIYLIIEEINRGNAAAIFGEMFQLLDRVQNIEKNNFSESEYPINNPNVQKWLKENIDSDEIKSELDNGVFIPGNLTVLATMNTSDQNVFTLDTAFKRRWSFEQISNDIEKDDKHTYKNYYIPGTGVTWEKFLTKINNEILESKILNSVNEDKRLGKYFISENMLTESVCNIKDVYDTANSFAYKILEYIWNDVCKMGRDSWFDTMKYKTLEDLINGFVNPVNSPLEIFKNINFE